MDSEHKRSCRIKTLAHVHREETEKVHMKMLKMSSLDKIAGNLILFLIFLSGFLSLTMNICYLCKKTYFKECTCITIIYTFIELNQQEILKNFKNISSFSSFVLYWIGRWVHLCSEFYCMINTTQSKVFPPKVRQKQTEGNGVKQDLNKNECTMFMKQRMCKYFLC